NGSTMRNGAVGSVASLWRYPVKSMMGEELDASDVSERGLVGDRAYALVDRETGKLASAKHPRKWSRLFDFGAVFIEPPRVGDPTPAVCWIACSRKRSVGRLPWRPARPRPPRSRRCGPRSRAPSCTAMFCLKRARRSSPMCRLALPSGTFFDFSAIHL